MVKASANFNAFAFFSDGFFGFRNFDILIAFRNGCSSDGVNRGIICQISIVGRRGMAV